MELGYDLKDPIHGICFESVISDAVQPVEIMTGTPYFLASFSAIS
jgi:hypothetical protein